MTKKASDKKNPWLKGRVQTGQMTKKIKNVKIGKTKKDEKSSTKTKSSYDKKKKKNKWQKVRIVWK